MLTLNGQRVEGHNLRLRLNFNLADEELSGQSASTARAEQGIKPQTLHVSLHIKQDDASALTELVTLARSTEADGSRTVYTLVNALAAACKIRQVVFTDNFMVNEVEGLRVWQVAFTLVEQDSRAEAQENRLVQSNTTSQAASSRFDEVAATADKVVP